MHSAAARLSSTQDGLNSGSLASGSGNNANGNSVDMSSPCLDGDIEIICPPEGPSEFDMFEEMWTEQHMF